MVVIHQKQKTKKQIMKKLFLINWGKDASGAKRAIVAAKSARDAFLKIDDHLGEISDVTVREINSEGDDPFYVELYDNPFCECLNDIPAKILDQALKKEDDDENFDVDKYIDDYRVSKALTWNDI
jgi:hypothetical protein